MTENYYEWSRPLVQKRVFAAALLTGTLYLIASQLDMIVNDPKVANIYSNIHMFVMAPFYYLISMIAYFKKSYTPMIMLLMTAPIVGVSINLFFIGYMNIPHYYLVELYLGVIWIFTISGLMLRHAMISATIVYILVLIVSYNMFFSKNELIMHIFWMSCAYSFGLLNATILDKANKKIFLNQEKLEELAVTDKLTGLYNRSKFELSLNSEIERSKRFNSTFGFIMIDIDYFKSINDTYGHNVGDSVLIEVSDIIKKHIRSTDIAVRWGGEEFVVIYYQTNNDKLVVLCETLRKTIENHTFSFVDKQTISIGATIYNNGDDSTSIIKRADKALYEAKNSGRNCIRFL